MSSVSLALLTWSVMKALLSLKVPLIKYSTYCSSCFGIRSGLAGLSGWLIELFFHSLIHPKFINCAPNAGITCAVPLLPKLSTPASHRHLFLCDLMGHLLLPWFNQFWRFQSLLSLVTYCSWPCLNLLLIALTFPGSLQKFSPQCLAYYFPSSSTQQSKSHSSFYSPASPPHTYSHTHTTYADLVAAPRYLKSITLTNPGLTESDSRPHLLGWSSECWKCQPSCRLWDEVWCAQWCSFLRA